VSQVWRMMRRIGDGEAAALLASQALAEIRFLAWQCVSGEERPTVELLGRVHFLADLVHNLPRLAGVRASRRRKQMRWLWSTVGPEGRSWILDTIEFAGCEWRPPSVERRTDTESVPSLSIWRQASVLSGWWPVRTPRGRTPLPRSARRLKALTTADVVAIYDEAERLELGLGKGGSWLQAHLLPDGKHYLVPDPASYYWPDPAQRSWWQCHALLQMIDGAQVRSMVAVLPERFVGLPDTIGRKEQIRLVHIIRATRYDTHQWARLHQANCGVTTCGYGVNDARG
jgi:hypothetical protein